MTSESSFDKKEFQEKSRKMEDFSREGHVPLTCMQGIYTYIRGRSDHILRREKETREKERKKKGREGRPNRGLAELPP